MPLDAIGLVSADLSRTAAFYRHLGIELAPAGGPDHWEGTTPSGVRLMADSHALMRKLHAGWEPPSPGAVTLAFAYDSPAEVDAVHATLVDAGFASVTAPWDAFWGQRYATVRDPDGNPVDLFAALPG